MKLGDSRVDTNGFDRHEYTVDGTRTVVYSAGSGDPLVYFHGAGTFHGFDFARQWTDQFRVFVPYHPGFGESEDNLRIGTMRDYIRHYVDLFEQMDLDRFCLVGCSMGGRMAAEFAATQSQCIERLALVCPAGLQVPEHPMTNLADIPPAEIFDYLVHDKVVLQPFLPTGPDSEFVAMSEREAASLGRILQEGSLINLKLAAQLRRIGIPTLLLWGAEDRVIPAAQAPIWASLLPNPSIYIVPDAGHLVLDESPTARTAVQEFLVRSTSARQARGRAR